MDASGVLRVVSLESRHAAELARLLERHGCQPISAPSMREIPLSDQHEAFEFGAPLLARELDVLVLLTGVGTRLLIDALATRWPLPDVLAALERVTLVCRGPKPVAVLKQLGLRPSLVAPEPNTWHELLELIDRELPVSGLRLVVQEYGRPSTQLIAALRERGADVKSVSVYGWAMPEDTAPLAAGIQTLADRQADVVLFTSGKQADHLMQFAGSLQRSDRLLSALHEHVLCVSIGPVCSETMRELGLPVDLEPPHPKMGQMVISVAKDGRRLVDAKRARLAIAR
ncbi:MAG TPA: uroporphyrinogen-III synthase [Polyangiales bacterium]|nr:uroporphyrinogen-III synthase [Polyangiales bacterium]